MASRVRETTGLVERSAPSRCHLKKRLPAAVGGAVRVTEVLSL